MTNRERAEACIKEFESNRKLGFLTTTGGDRIIARSIERALDAAVASVQAQLEAEQRAMETAKERALSILHCGNKEKRCETCAGMATYIVKLLAATPAGKTP